MSRKRVPILDQDEIDQENQEIEQEREELQKSQVKEEIEEMSVSQVLDRINGVVFKFGPKYFKIQKINKGKKQFTAVAITSKKELEAIKSLQHQQVSGL